MMETAPAVATWSWKDTMEAAALSRSRTQKFESYDKTRIEFDLIPLSIEEKKFPVECKPMRLKFNKKSGKMEPESMWIPFLEISAGSWLFRVTRNTDGGTIIRRSHEVRRRCGKAAAELFCEEALAFIKPRKEKPERKPIANPFHVESSGICNRFLKGKMQTEIGSPMFEYKDSDSSDAAAATLKDAFKSAALVRKALTPSRRRKAA